jgi:hypothetical protein
MQQVGNCAGLYTLTVYVSVVECAPASPYTNSSREGDTLQAPSSQSKIVRPRSAAAVVCWPIAVCSCAIHGGVACAMWRRSVRAYVHGRAAGQGWVGAGRGGAANMNMPNSMTLRAGGCPQTSPALHTRAPTLRLCDSATPSDGASPRKRMWPLKNSAPRTRSPRALSPSGLGSSKRG